MQEGLQARSVFLLALARHRPGRTAAVRPGRWRARSRRFGTRQSPLLSGASCTPPRGGRHAGVSIAATFCREQDGYPRRAARKEGVRRGRRRALRDRQRARLLDALPVAGGVDAVGRRVAPEAEFVQLPELVTAYLAAGPERRAGVHHRIMDLAAVAPAIAVFPPIIGLVGEALLRCPPSLSPRFPFLFPLLCECGPLRVDTLGLVHHGVFILVGVVVIGGGGRDFAGLDRDGRVGRRR